ncbi:MAG: glycoside hydrolase family 3 N-terminal domain-containing protein [Kofleriaceae bacterium]|nr:glycoside hydrolase family 3 N-terminal domain-containing protein [Kofleriaceae bacterium]
MGASRPVIAWLASLGLGSLGCGEVVDRQAVLPYRDPRLPIETRVEDLLARMTLDEKIGQMTLPSMKVIERDHVRAHLLGAVLSGGGEAPEDNRPVAWANLVDGLQEAALSTRLGIPLLYGVDAVHGHGNVYGATIFPHNIGLGAIGDEALVQLVTAATAVEVAATGIRWNYAPCLAVPQDLRWGRTYEGFSEDTALVASLGAAAVRGLQGEALAMGVLATGKHFIADGGTTWGTSTREGYFIDQGDARLDEATLRTVHLPPYRAAIAAGARSIMASFSSVNGVRMHANSALITGLLKEELGFTGFVVSDWDALTQLEGSSRDQVTTAINAGIDLVMVPRAYVELMDDLRAVVEGGRVTQDRIDDAVRRILRVKLELGLFEQPYADRSLLPRVGAQDHRDLAREAVQRSQVLLVNRNATLPLARTGGAVLVAGAAADDVGTQSGGWTIEWAGKPGPITPGSTILDGLREQLADRTVMFDPEGLFAVDGSNVIADVAVVVLGEAPYAEGVGDRASLALSADQLAVLERAKARASRVVLVVISGRPLVLGPAYANADAIVAAWLPGSEGAGVADVLVGAAPFEGRLPFTWPVDMTQVPYAASAGPPLFPRGHGLRYP